MKKLLFPLLVVLIFGGASILLLPPSQAQSGPAVCDVASGAVCIDPATIEMEDPNDPDTCGTPELPCPLGLSVGTNALVNDPNDSGKPQNEPYISMNPGDLNHLVAGANDFFQGIGGDPTCGHYRSPDGGLTWPVSESGALPLPGGFPRASDPGLAFSPDPVIGGERRVYYSCVAFNLIDVSPTNGTVFMVWSDDGGITFPVANLRIIAQGGSSTFNDKPFIAADQSNSAHRGNVYVSWTRIVLGGAAIQVKRSTDNGDTWSAPITLSTDAYNQGSVPFVGQDGTVYVAWARLRSTEPFKTNRILISRSTDGGQTWSPQPVIVADNIFGLPNNPRGQTQLVNTKFRVNSFPTAAVDPTRSLPSGELHLAWGAYRSATNTNADIFVTRSTNQGGTWTTPVRLSAQYDQFFPWLSVSPSGSLDLVYYSRTNTTKARFNLMWRRSTDGGQTFSAETQVNDGGKIKAAQFNGEFIGDYIGSVSGPVTIHPVWMDTRRLKPGTQKFQQDIWSTQVTP